MLNETIRSPTTSNNSLSPKLKWCNSKIKVKFKGSYLKQDKVTFTPNNLTNLFTVYELDRWSQDLNADFTLKDYLFGAVKFKNSDPDKYSYSGYRIGFDPCSLFSAPNFNWGKNIFIFRVDIYNKKKDILILGEDPTQGSSDTTIIAEAEYSNNFSRSQRNFFKIFIIMETTAFFSLIAQKYINSKQKIWNKTRSILLRKYFKRFHS